MKGDRLARGGSLHTAPRRDYTALKLILGIALIGCAQWLVDLIFSLGGR